MMPGNIAIRTVRVECTFMDDASVKNLRAKDKVNVTNKHVMLIFNFFFFKDFKYVQ
jgi:hypothetical protein